MARNIDADAAVEEARLAYCKDCNSYNGVKCRACAFDDAMSFIEDYPAADVAPKSEVAREILEEIDKKVKASITVHLEEINKEYIKDTPLYDRHSGILFALQYMDDFIAELKKKYTEDHT